MDILKIKDVGVTQRFLDIGGDSLSAVRLVSAIERSFGVKLPVGTVAACPTIEALAIEIEHKLRGPEAPPNGCKRSLSKDSKKQRKQIFLVPPAGGNSLIFTKLIETLHDQIEFIILEPPGLDGVSETIQSVENLAKYHEERIIQEATSGEPLIFAGWCFGGLVAYELSRLFSRKGWEVEVCVQMQTYLIDAFTASGKSDEPRWLNRHLRNLSSMNLVEKSGYIGSRIRNLLIRAKDLLSSCFAKILGLLLPKFGAKLPLFVIRERVFQSDVKAFRRFTPELYHGNLTTLWFSCHDEEKRIAVIDAWNKCLDTPPLEFTLRSTQGESLKEPFVSEFGDTLVDIVEGKTQ